MSRVASLLMIGAALGVAGVMAGGGAPASATATGAQGLDLFRQVYETVRDKIFTSTSPTRPR